MDIKHYINIIWGRKWIILSTFIVTMIVVILGTMRTVPIYSATATIRIALSTIGSVSYQDYLYADRLMNTYVDLATTSPVLEELTRRLDLTVLPSIEVKAIPTTELIQITTNHKDPNTAALMANTLADILIGQSSELYTGTGGSAAEILFGQVSAMEQEVNQAQADYENIVSQNPSDAEAIQTAKGMLDLKQQMYATTLEQYEQSRIRESLREGMVTIVEPALAPEKPTKPNKVLNFGLGGVIGIVGGLGLAFLFENLDTTLRTTEQIETISQLPILGKVPKMNKENSFEDQSSIFGVGESFRRLRTNILSTTFPIRTLLITSAEPNEGKSRIVANIAYSMAQNGRKVVVVDGDLRVPVQHLLFTVENKFGLSNVLEDKTNFNKGLQTTRYDGISLLPSGPIPDNPSELIGTEHMKKIIEMLESIFDLVIIDTPASFIVSDAIVLAPMADAIALVVQKGRSSSTKLQSVISQLKKVNPALIGVIVNRSEQNSGYDYYYKGRRS